MSTHNIPFPNIKRKSSYITPYLQLWDFSKALKNEFETAIVNEPSVFEPLKLYCIVMYISDTFFPLKFTFQHM